MLDKELLTFRLKKTIRFLDLFTKTLTNTWILTLHSVFPNCKISASFVQIFFRVSYAEGSTKVLLCQSNRKTDVKFENSDR